MRVAIWLARRRPQLASSWVSPPESGDRGRAGRPTYACLIRKGSRTTRTTCPRAPRPSGERGWGEGRKLRQPVEVVVAPRLTIMGRGEPPRTMKCRLAPDRSLTPTLSQRARERTCCANFIVTFRSPRLVRGPGPSLATTTRALLEISVGAINRPESKRRRVAATVGGRDPAVELTGTSLQRVAASRLRLLLQPSIRRA